MSYAKLLGLKDELTDSEIVEMLKEGKISNAKKASVSNAGVTGDFGEPTG